MTEIYLISQLNRNKFIVPNVKIWKNTLNLWHRSFGLSVLQDVWPSYIQNINIKQCENSNIDFFVLLSNLGCQQNETEVLSTENSFNVLTKILTR
jgi:hypothetical protein